MHCDRRRGALRTTGREHGHEGNARPLGKPFAATAAIAVRMRQLGMTCGELAQEAGMTEGTLRYFGLLGHDPQTLQRLSAALGWPRDHIVRRWGDDTPRE
jgi:hypothetical protein